MYVNIYSKGSLRTRTKWYLDRRDSSSGHFRFIVCLVINSGKTCHRQGGRRFELALKGAPCSIVPPARSSLRFGLFYFIVSPFRSALLRFASSNVCSIRVFFYERSILIASNDSRQRKRNYAYSNSRVFNRSPAVKAATRFQMGYSKANKNNQRR